MQKLDINEHASGLEVGFVHVCGAAVKLKGWDEDSFFDQVNKYPRIRVCDGCGEKFCFQWKRLEVWVWE